MKAKLAHLVEGWAVVKAKQSKSQCHADSNTNSLPEHNAEQKW